MDQSKRNRFGLIGRNISYSFSRGYFSEKFTKLGLDNCSYENFDLPSIEDFETKVASEEHLRGLNITIPYKQEIIPYLDVIEQEAKAIGAVNTIKITDSGFIGYNTDYYGFKNSIEPLIKKHHQKALILGTGGASKAVAYTFDQLGIAYKFVSRTKNNHQFTYDDLTDDIIREFTVIVNCSPVGTHPNVDQKPNLPYAGITDQHLLYDLIYNPEKTAFLKEGEQRGAVICNGLQMLIGQAEKAWEIWNQ